jgi:hypothetical protein
MIDTLWVAPESERIPDAPTTAKPLVFKKSRRSK